MKIEGLPDGFSEQFEGVFNDFNEGKSDTLQLHQNVSDLLIKVMKVGSENIKTYTDNQTASFEIIESMVSTLNYYARRGTLTDRHQAQRILKKVEVAIAKFKKNTE